MLDDRRLPERDGVELLARAVGPEDFHCVGPGRVAQSDGDRKFGLREVTARGHDLSRERLGADTHFDPRANGVAIAPGAVKESEL